MNWRRIRRTLDVSGRRRMREAARQRAAALEAGDTAAADAVTASYVAAEWARATSRIVPASPETAWRAPAQPPHDPGAGWLSGQGGEDAAIRKDR